ncbi:hypothetical protein [Paraburkholderia graminis]
MASKTSLNISNQPKCGYASISSQRAHVIELPEQVNPNFSPRAKFVMDRVKELL